ncbi:hypothetical protein F4212_14770 [Candidatus Poribacteria bacterium]|nr:hypothetical protein [Candidatus Poribacteria bacterium]
MDQLDILLALLGILISIVLYFLARRTLIGARQERIRSANHEIEKILVRRIVLEGYDPTQAEIVRLIDTKARDSRVRSTDLLSDSQLMNIIYTRIVESDFILLEQRQQILDRVSDAIEVAEQQPTLEQTADQIDSQQRSGFYATSFSMVAAAVAASLIGAVFTILPDINEIVRNVDKFSSTLPLTIATALMSLVTMSFISVVYGIRERQQEEPNKASPMENYLAFEKEVFRAIKKSRTSIIQGPVDEVGHREYDFLVELSGELVLVEVKNWTRNMPPSLIGRTFEKLKKALEDVNASYAVIVVRKLTNTRSIFPNNERVKVMTLEEFRKHLSQKR